MDGQQHGPLSGFTIGVTAVRRAAELGELLRLRGGVVLHAPALRIVPLADDTELRAATEDVIAHAPDVVVATTAVGLRGWVEAAAGWGRGAELLDRLRGVELLARGPKARGAVRAAGLVEAWSPASESMADVLERLLGEGVEGRRIAVQLHGEPLPGFAEALRAGGADVVPVPVHRWMPPADPGPLDRLIDATVARSVDAVTFTSAPAAASLLARAEHRGKLTDLLDALHHDVAGGLRGTGHRAAAPGAGHRHRPARPLPHGPARRRALRRTARPCPYVAGRGTVCRDTRPRRPGRRRPAPRTPGGHGPAARADPAAGVGGLAGELLRALPGSGRDEHAVETAMARLRTALGAPKLIHTVVKRGYRLALDPSADTKYGTG